MIVINRLCRNNSNKCLINFITTTVTSRCEKPKDEINETEKKNMNNSHKKDKKKSEQKAASKKMFDLFENNISEEKSSEAVKKLKTLKMSDTPVKKIVDVTQKMETKSKTRPVDEAAKKAKSQLEYNLVKSAKRVADEFGGDVNKTDKELLGSLSKFLDDFKIEPQKKDKSHKFSKQDEMKQKHGKHQDEKVGSKMPKETERLKGILGDINKISKAKEEPKKEYSDPVMLADLLAKAGALDIFHPDLERDKGAKLKLWHELEKDELRYLVSSAPRNYYQELIKWTEEGKLWHFPINNEQGMDEEANVDFTEHVFLEDHLEPWCPKSGPLRHFMELVCVGLSKNPYLKVEDKVEHIHWFRDYFEEKKRILQELGAISRKEIEQPKQTATKQETD